MEKNQRVGTMQIRLECMLAVSSRGLSRTKSSCCGLSGYHHLAWTDGKEPLTSGWSSKTWSPREEPSYRPWRVLLLSALLIQELEDCFQSLKINSKQVTEIWYKKRASSSMITDWECVQFAGTCSRSIARISHTTQKSPRVLITAHEIQRQAEERLS